MLEISSDGMVAQLAPALGGSILAVSDADGPLLRAGAARDVAHDPRAAAAFPCIPWFGRLDPDFTALGRKALLSATLPDASPLPLHGDGWMMPWKVKAHARDRLTCQLSVPRSPSGFPFAYEAEQEFHIDGRALHIVLLLRNADSVSMPAGLGLHPYFVRRPSTGVAFSATGMWSPPIHGPGSLGDLPSALGAGAAASLPDTTLDHSFTGFSGTALIADDARAVRLSSDAPILHVYAPAGEEFFCLEPVTHLPGDFSGRSAEGAAAILAPGERMSIRLVIDRPF